MRHRDITRPPADGAIGCNLILKEVRDCKSAACSGIQDCEMSKWADWSACQQAIGCGVGYRERSRMVAKGAGEGGHPCNPVPLKEAQPWSHCPNSCHENCVDGKWEDWQEWTPCDITCGIDGKRSRQRKALQASHCGFPAVGPDTQYEGCSGATKICTGHIDCTWTEW